MSHKRWRITAFELVKGAQLQLKSVVATATQYQAENEARCMLVHLPAATLFYFVILALVAGHTYVPCCLALCTTWKHSLARMQLLLCRCALVLQLCYAFSFCFQLLLQACCLLPAVANSFSSCTFIDLHDLHHLWHVNTAYHNAEFGRLTVLLLLS